MALSDFGLTENDSQYLLGSVLHAIIVQILVYGMYTVVYCVALYLTLSRGRFRSAGLITMIWILITIQTSVRWAVVDYTFVRHATSRETQIIAATDLFLPLDVPSLITSILCVLFVDTTMIWRCWVIYGRQWSIIILPVLSLCGGTAVAIFRCVLRYTKDSGVSASTVTQSTLEVVFLSTTVFTSIFCTFAIIYRLVSNGGLSKSLKMYRGIMEILVESAILYTSVYLIQIGLEVHTMYFTLEWDYRYIYVQSLANVITGIAPTFIIARVAAGHTRPHDSWTRASLPHIRTNMQSLGECLRFARPAGTGPTSVGPERSVERERSLEADSSQYPSASHEGKGSVAPPATI